AIEVVLQAMPGLAVVGAVFRIIQREQLGLVRLRIHIVKAARRTAKDRISCALACFLADVNVIAIGAQWTGYTQQWISVPAITLHRPRLRQQYPRALNPVQEGVACIRMRPFRVPRGGRNMSISQVAVAAAVAARNVLWGGTASALRLIHKPTQLAALASENLFLYRTFTDGRGVPQRNVWDVLDGDRTTS